MIWWRCQQSVQWSHYYICMHQINTFDTLNLHVICQMYFTWQWNPKEYWSGLPFPSPGDLIDSGIEGVSPGTNHTLIKSFTLGNKSCFLYQSYTYWGRIIFKLILCSQIIIIIKNYKQHFKWLFYNFFIIIIILKIFNNFIFVILNFIMFSI